MRGRDILYKKILQKEGETMSLKKILVSGAAALALTGTVATAALTTVSDPKTEPVKVACDGTGDYLLTPVYYATKNWSTELKVVNTNTTRAIVAKVVVRESKESDEIMDFAIFLSPGDVWTASLYEEGGEIKLKSTDDSMIIGGNQASPSNPIIIDNNRAKRDGAQNGKYHHENWHGYVEIFGAASYDPHAIDANWTKACDQMDKMKFYNAVRATPNIKSGYDVKDVDNDTLMGKATIYAEDPNVNGRRYMSINMLALENFSGEPVLTNIMGGDTKIENMSSKKANVLVEYDEALAKSNVYVMYEGDGNSVFPVRTHFTVPTKKYWFDLMSQGSITSMPAAYQVDNLYGETPAVADTPSEFAYELNPTGDEIIARNLKEKCNKCAPEELEVSGIEKENNCKILVHEEVHFFEQTNTLPANLYDAGKPYADLLFAEGGYVDINVSNNNYDTTGLTAPVKGLTKTTKFNGMPVVPTTFTAKKMQGIYLNNWLYNQYKNVIKPSS